MGVTPHVRCAECGHVFASDAGMDDEVTCPACGHHGPPGGVMRPTGFPSLETFKRNVAKVRGERDGE
ncbi:MAG TPA: hypothetical protein VKA00_01790 [Trueperaceae bacterium]|nr:hypothetical protein [Trueperaceae bacterium]